MLIERSVPAILKLPASNAMSLTPVFGLAAGVGVLGEPLTLRLVVALVAVVLGLVLINRR